MTTILYRCPVSGQEVARTVDSAKDTLVKMGEMKLSIWLSCPTAQVVIKLTRPKQSSKTDGGCAGLKK
jgi:hypothetical protein